MSKKPCNVVIFGLSEKNTAEIVRELRRRETFNVVRWFGILEDSDINTFEFYQHKIDYDYRTPVPEELYYKLHKELFHFIDDNMRRHTIPHASRRIPARVGSLYEDLDAFHRYLYFFWDLLTREKVDMVIVDGAPHCSADWVMVKVAEYLGITSLILYPVPLVNRYMYLTDFSNNHLDFSVYSTDERPLLREAEHYPLNPEEKLFYMTATPLAPVAEDTRLLTREDWQWIFYTWKWDFCKALKLKSFMKKMEDPQRTYMLPRNPTAYTFKKLWHDLRQDLSKLLRKRDWFALAQKARLVVKYLDYKDYRKALYEATEKQPVDLGKPFVYVPLHFQPEMTTQAQSNQIYLNQALMLERLSCLLPEDWSIYVKENPIQYETCRSKSFYDRLKAIHNLKIVPVTTNTFQLTQNSQFVATISGTVGWEALKNGKKVLLFGNAWYQGLPGVIPYRENLSLTELLDYNLDSEQLQQAINALMARMNEGVANVGYSKMLEDFDLMANARQIADFFERFADAQVADKAQSAQSEALLS